MAARRKKSPATAAQADQPPATESPAALTEVRPVATEGQTPPVPEAEGGPRRQWQPDPFPLMVINLGPDKDSPTMKLFRSNKLNQMAVQFAEKPEEEYRGRLREAGWKWREAEGVWTKQLDRERRASSQVEAEQLFTEIGEAIRARAGLSGRSDVGG